VAVQAEAVLDETLARQEGVIARWQVKVCGLTDGGLKSRVRSGRWRRLHPGVYASFSGPPPRRALLWAAVLRAGPGAVLSHHTAAELDGLADDAERSIHVTVGSDRCVSLEPPIRVHYSSRLGEARHPAKAPPRTRIEETVLDLTQVAWRNRHDLDRAIAWTATACQRRLTTADRLLAAMSGRGWMHWRAELTAALSEVGAGAHTLLELRYVTKVERPHGLPAGVRQTVIRRKGGHAYRDVDYPDYGTAVELDGWFAHPFEQRWMDMDRDNRTVARGEAPLRFGWGHVTGSPCRVAAIVAFVLGQRGWREQPRTCGPGCEVFSGEWIKDRGRYGCPGP
jgi:hypothetical protein